MDEGCDGMGWDGMKWLGIVGMGIVEVVKTRNVLFIGKKLYMYTRCK